MASIQVRHGHHVAGRERFSGAGSHICRYPTVVIEVRRKKRTEPHAKMKLQISNYEGTLLIYLLSVPYATSVKPIWALAGPIGPSTIVPFLVVWFSNWVT